MRHSSATLNYITRARSGAMTVAGGVPSAFTVSLLLLSVVMAPVRPVLGEFLIGPETLVKCVRVLTTTNYLNTCSGGGYSAYRGKPQNPGYPSLKRRVVESRQRHNAHDVVIEDKGSGTPLIQDLKREGAVRPIAFMPEGDKLIRMSAQSAKIEAGQVHLPRQASWLGDFRTELMAFPHGRHDDQVDSLSQFLTWIEQRRSRRKRVGYLFHPSSSRQ